ncbi:MAG: hypothetical protein ACO22D_05485 [Schleiferiaceae bacterium]
MVRFNDLEFQISELFYNFFSNHSNLDAMEALLVNEAYINWELFSGLAVLYEINDPFGEMEYGEYGQNRYVSGTEFIKSEFYFKNGWCVSCAKFQTYLYYDKEDNECFGVKDLVETIDFEEKRSRLLKIILDTSKESLQQSQDILANAFTKEGLKDPFYFKRIKLDEEQKQQKLFKSVVLKEVDEIIKENTTKVDAFQQISSNDVQTKSEISGSNIKEIDKKENNIETKSYNSQAGTSNKDQTKPEKSISEFWLNIKVVVFLSIFFGGIIFFYWVIGHPDDFPLIFGLIAFIIFVIVQFIVCSAIGGLITKYIIHDYNESFVTHYIRGLIALILILLFAWLSFDIPATVDPRRP